MSYLTKSDLAKSIEQQLLETLDFSSDDSIITTACAQAMGQIKAYIIDKYDILAEFAKPELRATK